MIKISTFIGIALLTVLNFSCEQDRAVASSSEAAKVTPVALAQKTVRDTTPPQRSPNYVVESSRPRNEIKQSFPYDIKLTTADEKTINSAEVLAAEGKPVVLLFWLTTCYPCRMEMAAIEKQYEKWQQEADFKLIAISTDFQKNFPNFIKRVEESNWPWEVYHDTNREFRYVLPGGLNGLPQTFIMNSKGEIVYHKRKYSPGDEHNLFEEIKKAVI